MSAKFSATTGGIYPITAFSEFPPDALDIPAQVYADYCNGKFSRLTVVNGTVVAYQDPAPTLVQAQAAQISAINAACQIALSTIIAPYPPSEIDTWPQQYAESLAYTANNTAATPMLSAIAAASSQTVAALVASVLAKATAYQAAAGAAVGKRQALSAQINAATTVAAAQAITW